MTPDARLTEEEWGRALEAYGSAGDPDDRGDALVDLHSDRAALVARLERAEQLLRRVHAALKDNPAIWQSMAADLRAFLLGSGGGGATPPDRGAG